MRTMTKYQLLYKYITNHDGCVDDQENDNRKIDCENRSFVPAIHKHKHVITLTRYDNLNHT